MNLTSRSRYALKIMMDLAIHGDEPHIHRKDIAARQGIPTDYLDQIMILLRRGELVASVRGRGGGYKLAKPAHQISMWDLFSTVESAIEPVQCLGEDKPCGFDVSCSSHAAWHQIFSAMRQPLEAMSLQAITAQAVPQHQMCPGAGVRECRAPSPKTVSDSYAVGRS